jgi:hypothetical protein
MKCISLLLGIAQIALGIRLQESTKAMDTRMLVPLVIFVAAVIVILATLLIARKRKSDQLRRLFGAEYDRVLKEQGDARRAEAVQAQREKCVEKFSIRPLAAGDRREIPGGVVSSAEALRRRSFHGGQRGG